MDIDVYCTSCEWEGLTQELDGIKCPECGEGKYIEDAKPAQEYDNQVLGSGKFNWNKK